MRCGTHGYIAFLAIFTKNHQKVQAANAGITCKNGCPCLTDSYTWESGSNARIGQFDRTVIDGVPDMGDCPQYPDGVWGKWCNCDDQFPNPGETESFKKTTVDCRGNLINETLSGEWWHHNPAFTGVNFRGKYNSHYHYSPHPMTKDDARAYCKDRGFGDFVHLHCPNGTNENSWLCTI